MVSVTPANNSIIVELNRRIKMLPIKSITHFLIFLLLITSLIACRSTKKIQTVIAKKDTAQVVVVPSNDARADSLRFIRQAYNTIQKNTINYKTFSAKVKVDFEGKDGKKNDFNAFIRLHKDSIMWISINAALGIEAFRVLITPDSVKMLNKIDRVIQLRSLNYLQEVAQIPLTFSELQDLIIGNPIYFDSSIVSYKKEEAGVSVISIGKLFKHLLTVNPATYAIEHSKLDDVDTERARTADITYGGYERKDNILFSTFRKITVSEKSKLDIELQFKQFNFNEELSFPFTIPKNYKHQ